MRCEVGVGWEVGGGASCWDIVEGESEAEGEVKAKKSPGMARRKINGTKQEYRLFPCGAFWFLSFYPLRCSSIF